MLESPLNISNLLLNWENFKIQNDIKKRIFKKSDDGPLLLIILLELCFNYMDPSLLSKNSKLLIFYITQSNRVIGSFGS